MEVGLVTRSKRLIIYISEKDMKYGEDFKMKGLSLQRINLFIEPLIVNPSPHIYCTRCYPQAPPSNLNI